MSDNPCIDWLDFEDVPDKSQDSSFLEEFAVNFAAEVTEKAKSVAEQVGQIWQTIGLPYAYRDQKADQLQEALLEQCQQFVKHEKELLRKCLEFGEIKLKEINQMRADLSLPPFEMPEKSTLIARNKIFQSEYTQLSELKFERMEILAKIEKKLKRIAQQLGTCYQPTTFATAIPSEMELKSLSLILANQEKTLSERLRQYEMLKSSIEQLRSQLNYQFQDQSEKDLLNKEQFIFSPANLARLSDLNKKLARLYSETKSTIEMLQDRLVQLYNRLDVPSEVRDQFVDQLTGPLSGQKLMLEEEIGKYELIKKNSIGRIIQNIRAELTALFSRCMVVSFPDHLIDSNEFSEELLIELEKEAEQLKRFYACYGPVLEKLREFEEGLTRLVELEKKSTDPSRFTNRGGALLQMERDRKMLSKKLPKLEKEIRTMAADLESTHGLPIDIYGLDLDEFFESNWKHLSDLADHKQVSNWRFGNSSKSSNGGSCQKSAQKMRIPFSPRNANQASDGHRAATRRNLDTEMERNFMLGIHQNKGEVLHSTVLQEAENKVPHLDLVPPEMMPTPRVAPRRRRSRSCDPGPNTATGRLKLHRINDLPTGTGRRLEPVSRKPPFLP